MERLSTPKFHISIPDFKPVVASTSSLFHKQNFLACATDQWLALARSKASSNNRQRKILANFITGSKKSLQVTFFSPRFLNCPLHSSRWFRRNSNPFLSPSLHPFLNNNTPSCNLSASEPSNKKFQIYNSLRLLHCLPLIIYLHLFHIYSQYIFVRY